MKRLFKLFGGIFGSKKKNSKPLPSVSDTARSVAFGNVIEILCSGGKYGIEGLLTPANIKESIYLDETPLSRDGNDFFSGITVVERKGTPFQPILEGFNNELVSEVSVGAEIKNNLPITRSFVNDAVTAIRVRVSVVITKNRLDNGSVVQVIGDSLQFKIFIKEGNGAFVERGNITVNGKFSDAYEISYYFPVNSGQTEDEFFIRLERVTPADTENERRVLRWESYAEIIEEILPFKRMAVIGIRFDTEEFGSSFPERRYHIGGQYLDIPTNATEQPDRGLLYSGTWNGLFKPSNIAVADVFAIVWYLLLDDIDGVGDEIEASMVDRFGLYEISKYNNELIPDGKGGLERRFLCNFTINKRQDGWKVIDNVLSSCNARRFWEGGVLRFTQDRPDRVFAVITNADILDAFDYSSTDIDDRATACYITWIDLNNFGKTRSDYVADPVWIAKIGYNLKEIEAVGCTRRSQAQRYGRSIIYAENEETEIVTFKGRQRIANLPIGKIVAIADYQQSDDRLGGLVISATTNTVTLDFPVVLGDYSGFDETFYLMLYSDVREAIRIGNVSSAYDHYVQYGISEGRHTNGYLLLVQLPNNSLEIRRVTNVAGSYTTLTVDGNFATVPTKFCSWALFTPQYKHKLWRVLSKEPDEDNIDVVQMTCTQYSEFKWERIERRIEIEEDEAPPVEESILAPTQIKVNHHIYNDLANIEISWNIPPNNIVKRYIFSYKFGGSWIDVETVANNYSVSSVLPGIYQFRVASISFTNLVSPWFYSDNFYITSSNAVAIGSNSYYSTFVEGI